jgi:serine/threonine protein kinase/tetratricopeptide (TPR) repeat protein
MAIDPKRWLHLSPWLDQVLDLPAPERDAWLSSLAARDPALADDLRDLLAGGAGATGPRLLHGASPFEVLQPLAGRRIGAYTLVEPLGEGGMGSVWLAERSDGRFEGRAAVKLLHAGIVQRALADRFRREGAILARLSHPHIARLVDAGLTDDGQPYLVLEHVAGERVDRWCDARQLGLRARLDLFAQVLQAVQHAHGQLVVHRDLKPGNVMVDAQGAVKLLDFGIAKLLSADDALAEATELTREAGRMLTPLFAAPEQTRGDPVTTATDVYALGLLLYLLLTGQHPRVDAQGRDSRGAGPLPLASQAVTDSGRRSGEDLRAAAETRGTTPARLGHALAGDLDNILAKALREEPTERYATVAAFADDLQRHLAGHTVSARPDSWAYRVHRFVGRHRVGVGLAAVALVSIVGMAAVADQQRRIAEHERDQATRQQAAAEAVAILMEELLGQIGQGGQASGPPELVDHAQRRAEQLFADNPEVLARMQRHFLAVNYALQRGPEMRRNISGMASAAERIVDPVARAEAECAASRSIPQVPERVARIRQNLASLPPGERSRSARWSCLFANVDALLWLGRVDEAEHALDAATREAPPLVRRLREVVFAQTRADLFAVRGMGPDFLRALEEVGRLYEVAGRGRSAEMAFNLGQRSVAVRRMGRPRDALALAEQAERISRDAGPESGLTAESMITRARALLELDRTAEGLPLLEAGLALDRYPESLNLALAHRLRGEHAKAVEVLQADITTQIERGGTGRASFLSVPLAEAWLAKAEPERALAALDVTHLKVDGDMLRWDRAWLRAQALNALGRSTEAEAAARAAIAEAARRAPPQGRSALHGHSFLELARALTAQGRAHEACVAAERAALEFYDALGPTHGATRAAVALARR